MQGLWIVAALVVLAAALDLVRVRVLPRRACRPWGWVVARLWLIASCLGLLAMTAVGGLAWLSQSVMAVSHNPATLPWAAALGNALSLAGHTHGGQIHVALGHCPWSPARLLTPCVAGLYRLPCGPKQPASAEAVAQHPPPSAILYLHRGLGTGALPGRLGVPPESTVLTLRAAG